MTRIIKEHAVRRDEILDAAQRRIYSSGYEKMTIQDILNDLDIAKGTFYHYFDSKQALLEALIKRMLDAVDTLLIPIVEDPQLRAMDKFKHFFGAISRLKTEQKPFLLALIRVWTMDENALLRQKVHSEGVERITPLLMAIIRQGMAEDVLKVAYPDQIGGIVIAIQEGLDDALAALLLASPDGQYDVKQMETIIAAYTAALEQVMGAQPGSLHLVDTELLEGWNVAPED